MTISLVFKILKEYVDLGKILNGFAQRVDKKSSLSFYTRLPEVVTVTSFPGFLLKTSPAYTSMMIYKS